MKTEKLFKIIFITFFVLLFILAIINLKPVETNLLKAFVEKSDIKSEHLLQLADFSSLKVNVIFEGDNYASVEVLKDKFQNSLATLKIKSQNFEFNQFTDIYSKCPYNFLSEEKRNLLKSNKYNLIDSQSLNMLYNPLGIYIISPSRDPYLFVTDFVMNLQNRNLNTDETKEYQGKYYSLIKLELSKDITNYQVSRLVD